MTKNYENSPPIPMILSAYKAASGFHNFAFCTLISSPPAPVFTPKTTEKMPQFSRNFEFIFVFNR